jgi:transcription elongation factor Elf1
MEDTEIEFIEYQVTCRTEGCENSDITINIQAPKENAHIVCGVCGQQITDVTPIES